MSNDAYLQATRRTAADLKTVAAGMEVRELSHLSLPEIDALTDEIARVVPAGNVPGLILSGLTRLAGRKVPTTEHQKNIGLLFLGARDLMDKAVYATMFAGPAAIIMAYQNLLKLAGKDIDSAFPEGTWQFYLEYALREDTARYANETTGFQRSLALHNIKLPTVDTLTAWVMTAMVTLHQYPRLLENEWRERVYTHTLRQIAPEACHNLTLWNKQRPYGRGHDAGNDNYPTYRRRKFDALIASIVSTLPPEQARAFHEQIAALERDSLPAYQGQMSILATLKPENNRDYRIAYPLNRATIGIIYQGEYTFIPASITGGLPNVHTVRGLIADLLSKPPAQSTSNLDLLLANTSRGAQENLRTQVDPAVLQAFSTAPIILNWDHLATNQPLAIIRQAQRGIGDHALTLFFTEDSTVFDQSHIFFDGAWGSAIAEIMTNEALSWGLYLSQLAPAAPLNGTLKPLAMPVSNKLVTMAAKARRAPEVSAESTAIRLGLAQQLRRMFKARNDLVTVTVNDLLILYRSLHGQRYRPSAELVRQLELLRADGRPGSYEAYTAVKTALDHARYDNPALLIPMDASQHSPKERIYPTTFRNPMTDLLRQHDATLAALRAYQAATNDRTALYETFDERQRAYLRVIASFGVLLTRYKEVALSGQSTSTMSIKMLAHMPEGVQRLLDQIPERVNVLNEVIKGEEVFSNVGRVAPGSSLRRFITAKDDNPQKSLAWGFLTDDQDIMHVSLRDFRPHVKLLVDLKQTDLAQRITQDFLDSFVDGFNLFVRELREMTIASRETQLHSMQ